MGTLWIKILSFLTGLEKIIELADSFWKRRNRVKEIEEVKKEDIKTKETVDTGSVDDINDAFGWKDKK